MPRFGTRRAALNARARAAVPLSVAPLAILAALCAHPAAAEEARIAVAANFAAPLHAIVADFERATGHAVAVSSGSSGTLYAQITHGAPFHVFFSADAARPKRLEEDGLAVRGSRMTYAVGRLALWSADPGAIKADGRSALSGRVGRLAIANPGTSPYGAAARQTLHAMGLWHGLQDRIVRGDNIGQTFQFVFSRNARLGFVSLSQLLHAPIAGTGSRWDVPAHLHDPLRQQAVLLVAGRDNEAATAFLEHARGPEARSIIARFGYGLD